MNMVRYTKEQKEQAIKSVEEIGVYKTKEALGISAQTLYIWKNEDAQVKPQSYQKNISQYTKAKVKKAAKELQKSVHTDGLEASVAEVRCLLQDDSYLSDKVKQLENEVALLCEQNVKLKKALISFLG